VASDTTGELAYRLGSQAVRQRALAGVAIAIVRSLAPIALAVVLLRRLGWATPVPFWIVVGALAVLVMVRAVVGFGTARRRLGSLEVTVTDEAIEVRGTREAYGIERSRVARMTEVTGPLGGIIVESQPDARSGVVLVAQVPRGGAGYGAVRHRLERWRAFERRGRRGPAARVAVFGLVVASIFFVPFLLDDFVAHSRLLGAMLIAGLLFVLRGAVRG
jgi:hypothetical protein